MTDFADTMAVIDAAIDASLISDDLVLPDGTSIRGRMLRDEVELQTADGGSIAADEVVFRTAYTPALAALPAGELVLHNDNRYTFRRRVPDRGDTLGRVDLLLADAP